MASCKYCGAKEPVMHCVCAGCMDKLERRRWVSVKEKLPPNIHARVLVNLIPSVPQGGKPTMDADRFVDGKWVRWNGLVTHWMELPEPPKEGEADE